MDINEPILVLESRSPDEQGDLEVFRNASVAVKKLEAIDVANNEFYAFTLSGKQLSLSVDNRNVRISLTIDGKDNGPLVREHLEKYVDLICTRKMLGRPDFAAMTNQQLAEIIGYTS